MNSLVAGLQIKKGFLEYGSDKQSKPLQEFTILNLWQSVVQSILSDLTPFISKYDLAPRRGSLNVGSSFTRLLIPNSNFSGLHSRRYRFLDMHNFRMMRLTGARSNCNLAKCGSEMSVFQVLHTHQHMRRELMGSCRRIWVVKWDGRLSK